MITILYDPPVALKSTPIFEEIPNQQHILPVDFLFMTLSSPDHSHFNTAFPEYFDPSATTSNTTIMIPYTLPQVPQSRVPMDTQPKIVLHYEPEIGKKVHTQIDLVASDTHMDAQEDTLLSHNAIFVKEQLALMIHDPQ
jgi:hypothetical protein